MHDGNRCEEIKEWNGKAVINGREMVGVKHLVRRKMALNETRERGSLRWKIEMRSLTASLARDTSSENASPRKYI